MSPQQHPKFHQTSKSAISAVSFLGVLLSGKAEVCCLCSGVDRLRSVSCIKNRTSAYMFVPRLFLRSANRKKWDVYSVDIQ